MIEVENRTAKHKAINNLQTELKDLEKIKGA